MEDTVKKAIRQILPTILNEEEIADVDVVNLVLMMGVRRFNRSCENKEVTTILSQAINDAKTVASLVDFFSNYADDHAKKELQKKQAEVKAEASKKLQQRELKEKAMRKPVPKSNPTTDAVQHNTVDELVIPLPEKKARLQGQQQVPEGQTEPAPPSIAAGLLKQGKVRCKYFPFCKNQKCEYFHPTEKCPYFPRCRFAEKCMFIHEACKYSENCTRANCYFDHPFKKKSDNPMLQLMKMAMGQSRKPPIRKKKFPLDAAQNEKPNPPKEESDK